MSQTVRITVLVENTARGAGLLGEHGLAYWIETAGRHLLFDTGQGNTLAANAYRLDCPLRQLDTLVLSHGHYDHTGGIAEALRNRRSVSVYAHPAAFAPKFGRLEGGGSREIGAPASALETLAKRPSQIIHTNEPTPLAGGLVATGPVPRTTDFEDTGGPFFLDSDCQTPDLLEDDQSLLLPTRNGIVVLLGCAHSGVVNTLRYVRELTSGRPIWAVVGGMHLGAASTARLDRTIEELRRLEPRILAPAHCTGTPATAALWNAFPGRCRECHVGTRFEFELAP